VRRCADIAISWLIRYGAIEETDRALYIYAFDSFLLLIAPLLLSIGFGLLLGCIKQSIMIVIPFMALRKFSGGYHTKNAWSCLICSSLLLILCMEVASHVICTWGLAFVTLVAGVGLMIFSPIDHENRRLQQNEKIFYKRIVIILVVIFEVLDVLFYLLGFDIVAICFAIGIILSAGLQIPCIVIKYVGKKY
jgi:accessory gene regulator B